MDPMGQNFSNVIVFLTVLTCLHGDEKLNSQNWKLDCFPLYL